jgi:Putative zinc-finger/PilZ domain
MNREPAKKDNRQDARYPTNEAVTVSLAPYQQNHAAKILNVSRHGLQLELGCPLPDGARVEILTTAAGVVIFGDIRYCNQTGELFHVGVLIHDAIFAKPLTGEHADDDQLSLYAAGYGLGAAEVLRLKEHLDGCAKCRSALAETSALIRRMKGTLPAES